MKYIKAIGFVIVALATMPMLLDGTGAYGVGVDLKTLRDESASHAVNPADEIEAALSNAEVQACDGRPGSTNCQVTIAVTGMVETRQDIASVQATAAVVLAVFSIAATIVAKFR